MRALELFLNVRRCLFRLGKAQSTIVSAHPLEGTENHGRLAMNGNGLPLYLDVVGVDDALNFFAKPNSVFREIGDRMCLEEQFQGREEGLENWKSPRRSIH
jgi:hypothetical protein